MKDPNCIFCKIVSNEIPAYKVYEDDKALAFLDANPVRNGHLLVIPKEHHSSLSITPDELVGPVFVTAKKLIPVLMKATESDYVILTIIGTDVPHLHIHLIPRKRGDGLLGWPTHSYENTQIPQEITEKIRSLI